VNETWVFPTAERFSPLRRVTHSVEKTSGAFFYVSSWTRRIEDSCAFGYGRRRLCAFQPMSMS